MTHPIEATLAVFRALTDPRVERTRAYPLEIIMFIALCTYLSGGDSFYDMEDYAESREDWLREHINQTEAFRGKRVAQTGAWIEDVFAQRRGVHSINDSTAKSLREIRAPAARGSGRKCRPRRLAF